MLDEMCRHVTDTRALSSMMACSGHKSMHVRAKVASHMDDILEVTRSRSTLLNNWACLERLFKTAANFLDEGGCLRVWARVGALGFGVEGGCLRIWGRGWVP